MIEIGKELIKDWQLWGSILVLLIVLSLTGRLKKLLTDARRGLAEVFTLEGFIIAAFILYIIYQIYLKVASTL